MQGYDAKRDDVDGEVGAAEDIGNPRQTKAGWDTKNMLKRAMRAVMAERTDDVSLATCPITRNP